MIHFILLDAPFLHLFMQVFSTINVVMHFGQLLAPFWVPFWLPSARFGLRALARIAASFVALAHIQASFWALVMQNVAPTQCFRAH